MKITSYGHSCMAVEIGPQKLLFDPFITGNPKAPVTDPLSIQANYILVSHAHGDHTADALSIATHNQSTIISNYEICNWFTLKGIKKTTAMNFGGKVHTEFGSVRLVPAAHSSQFPDGSYGGNPGGFIIESWDENFYFAGDTSLIFDMKIIPFYDPLDFALLPVGGTYTMDYHDALHAAEFINCPNIIGLHFDTFPEIEIDHQAAIRFFEEGGKQLMLLKPGASFDTKTWQLL